MKTSTVVWIIVVLVVIGAGWFFFSGSSTTPSTAAPVVTAISPTTGTLPGGGDTVTITGSGFTGATAVNFGTVAAASFSVNSDSSITATSPAGASGAIVDVTVVTPNGTSSTGPADQFTFSVAPSTSSD